MEFAIPGLLLGFAASRGRFCLNSGFADAAFRGDFRKVNILLIAVLVQISLGFVLLLHGPLPALGSHSLLLLLAGGFFFGLLMPVSGGCPGGIVFKAAEGQLTAVFALIGFIAAMGVAYTSPMAPWLQSLNVVVPIADISLTKTAIAIASGVAFVFLLYLLFFFKNAKAEGALWSWKLTGLSIGLAGGLYTLLSQLVPAAPLGFMPGLISAWQKKLAPEVWFVGAVFLGSVIAAIAKGGFTFKGATFSQYATRFAGGFGLGVAASFAAGCSVGYSLTFLPLLSLQAFIALTAIFLGRVTSEKIRRRLNT